MKKYYPFFFLLTIIGLLIWSPIFKIFYQQDEWSGLGHIFAEGKAHVFWGLSFVQSLLARNRPLARLLGFFFFGKFPFETIPVAIFSVLLHILNSYLVFILAKGFIKSQFVSLIAAIFFLISSVSANAVSWFSTSLGTLPATTLILISIFYYFKFLEKGRSKWLLITFVLIYISLFFTEIGIYLFVFFPLVSLLFKKTSFKKFIKTYWPFLIFFILYASFRVAELKSISGEKALFLTGASENFLATLVARAILYPLTSFSLMYIPAVSFLNFARLLTNLYYPFIPPEQFILVAQSVVLDLLAIALSLFILIFLSFLGRSDAKTEKKKLTFWVGFTFFSFLPYVMISKSFAYLESRYYYLAAVGGGMILAWTLKRLQEIFKDRIVKVFLLLLVFFFILSHMATVKSDLSKQVRISRQRRLFLTQLEEIKPTLHRDKNVFYITSDTDFYVPGNKVPFQQGMGYTLMVWYYGSGKVPSDFLVNDYLFEIGSQGYKEADGFGFGYFSDKNVMEEMLSGTNSKKQIIYLYYDSTGKELMILEGAKET